MKVTKWSTLTGDFDVSDQKAEQTSGEPGSLSAGSAVPNSPETHNEPVAAAQDSAQEQIQAPASVGSPDLASEPGGAAEPVKADAPEADAAKVEAPNVEAPKVEAPKVEAPRTPGKLIMLSGDRAWDGNAAAPETEAKPNSGMFGKRRIAAMAAVVALAAMAGALGGALATASFGHPAANEGQVAANHALEEQVARLEADLSAARASIEHTAKLGMAQFNKTSDRLDKVEKAQLEPAAKIAKLSETVDKLRVAPVAAPTPVAAAAPAAAKEVTGSIAPPATAAATPAAPAAPKVEVGRLPTVDGWVLRDVADGGALIDGRRGVYEVYAGDFIPGLGRIDAIRRQDGRWVVVTSKGLIVAR
jgi:hypothetical protein